jgi:hypothetical protein
MYAAGWAGGGVTDLGGRCRPKLPRVQRAWRRVRRAAPCSMAEKLPSHAGARGANTRGARQPLSMGRARHGKQGAQGWGARVGGRRPRRPRRPRARRARRHARRPARRPARAARARPRAAAPAAARPPPRALPARSTAPGVAHREDGVTLRPGRTHVDPACAAWTGGSASSPCSFSPSARPRGSSEGRQGCGYPAAGRVR